MEFSKADVSPIVKYICVFAEVAAVVLITTALGWGAIEFDYPFTEVEASPASTFTKSSVKSAEVGRRYCRLYQINAHAEIQSIDEEPGHQM